MERGSSNIYVDMEIRESPAGVTDGRPLGMVLSNCCIMPSVLSYLDVCVVGVV